MSSALKLQNAGLCYYFESKDEVVIACAEEAVMRLENTLIPSALRDIHNPDVMMESLQKRADEMAPIMKFLVQACSTLRCRPKMEPASGRLCRRHEHYAEKFVDWLNCDVEKVLPYVYVCITAVSSHIILVEEDYIVPQMALIKSKINKLINNAEV